jgi:hypothetical protein
MATATITPPQEVTVGPPQNYSQPGDMLERGLTEFSSIREGLVLIENEAQMEKASAYAGDLNDLIKKIQAEFAPSKSAAHKAHRSITQFEGRVLAPLVDRLKMTKRGMTTWHELLENQRRAASRREQERIRREADDRRIEEAAALEEAGESAAADAVLDAPEPEPPAVIAPAPVKHAGVVIAKRWKGRVENLEAFLAEAAKDPRLHRFIMIDAPELNRFAVHTKGKTNVPGVEFYQEAQTRL